MVDLPMMGRAGMPDEAAYFPPAPSQSSFGSLGGLGRGISDFANSQGGNDVLRSMFMSMMTSPRNAPLQAMPEIMGGLQQQRFQQQKYDEALRERERDRQEATTKENRTVAWIKSNFPEMGDDQALAAATNPAILQHLMKQMQGGRDTTFGLNPIYGQDADGNTVMGVLGNDGTFKPVDTGGVTLSTGVDRVDLGTQYGLIDKRTGQVVGTLPKENYQEAFDKGAGSAAGKAVGEASVNLPTDLATAEQAITELDDLIAHPGLSAIAGPMDQYRPSWTMGSEGRDALARFNQAKGRAFLQAFGMLKGGGQITEIEGLKAEQAMARMDRAQGEAEFKQALTDFRDAVRTGMDKMRQRAGGGYQQMPQGEARRTSSNIPWSIEE